MPRLGQVRQELRILDNRTCEPDPVQGGCVLHCRSDNADSRRAPSNGPHVLLDDPQTTILLVCSAELQQVLDCVAAEEVAAERHGILQQGLCKIPGLSGFALGQQLLDNPATIAVCRNLLRQVVLRDLVDHELQRFCWHRADALLQDMVCMRATHSPHRVAMQLLNQELPFNLRGLAQSTLHLTSSFWGVGKRLHKPHNRANAT
mmetsp:Transcript_21545/g.53910  ORF Transcript_21545/g.53910 Transcript_21545/m.53910 type:complete len:204 (+) Transcript_21545:459-1070(+)